MTEPAKALYKGYTHTGKCFIPARREKQGVMPSSAVRIAPGIEVMEQVKVHVNRELKKLMAKNNRIRKNYGYFLMPIMNLGL